MDIKIIVLVCSLYTLGCKDASQVTQMTSDPVSTEAKAFPISKTEAEWEKELDAMEFYVLRKAATENPFTSELLNVKEEGIYVCAGCATPLFESKYKFDSGTGWPSFDREIKGNVAYDVDYKIGYKRTEEHCATCGGHLGHVFDDGPKHTTGKRHCINGVALDFVPKG